MKKNFNYLGHLNINTKETMQNVKVFSKKKQDIFHVALTRI